MRRAQAIQIGVLLAAIFAAGVATGRFTAPQGPVYVKNIRGRYATSETKVEELTRRLALDAKQKEQFRVLLEDVAKEMAKYAPLSQDRLEVFRKNIPKQRSLLRPDQFDAFDEMVKETEARFEQARRKQQRGGNR